MKEIVFTVFVARISVYVAFYYWKVRNKVALYVTLYFMSHFHFMSHFYLVIAERGKFKPRDETKILATNYKFTPLR